VLIGMPTFLYHVLTELADDSFQLPNLQRSCSAVREAPLGMRRKLRALARKLGAEKVDVCAPSASPRPSSRGRNARSMRIAGSAGYHIHPDLASSRSSIQKPGDRAGEGEPGRNRFTTARTLAAASCCATARRLHRRRSFPRAWPFCGRNVPRLVR
jgi:hypothetical protein